MLAIIIILLLASLLSYFTNFTSQMRADINVHSKQSHMTGVQFPVTDEALAKLADLKEKKTSLVQLVSETAVYTLSGLKNMQ